MIDGCLKFGEDRNYFLVLATFNKERGAQAPLIELYCSIKMFVVEEVMPEVLNDYIIKQKPIKIGATKTNI